MPRGCTLGGTWGHLYLGGTVAGCRGTGVSRAGGSLGELHVLLAFVVVPLDLARQGVCTRGMMRWGGFFGPKGFFAPSCRVLMAC